MSDLSEAAEASAPMASRYWLTLDTEGIVGQRAITIFDQPDMTEVSAAVFAAVEERRGLAKFDGVAVVDYAPPAPPQIIPDVSRAQGRIQLLRMGILAQVERKIAASSDTELQIWWSDAATWKRSSTYVGNLGAAMELTADQIDAAFIAAAAIEV